MTFAKALNWRTQQLSLFPVAFRRAAAPGAWFLAAIVVVILYGDRIGWEGDDLAEIFGATHLDVFGVAEVYRYHWQPFSYELMHALIRLGSKPLAMTIVSNVMGAVGLVLLGFLLNRCAQVEGRARWIAPLLILAVPELWITALYFNTTALGLPFFVGSLCVIAHTRASRWVFTSGFLLGLACLFRFDFATGCPFIGVWLFSEADRTRWRTLASWALGGLVALGFGIALSAPGLIAGIVEVGQRYESGQGAWGPRLSLKVLMAAVGPILLILPLLTSVRGLATALGTFVRTRPAMLIAMAPMLLPLRNLYSGKYLVPLFGCGVVVLGDLLRQPAVRMAMSRRRVLMAWGVLVMSWIVTVPTGTIRSINLMSVFTSPRLFLTHDGYRTFGGYAHLLAMLRKGDLRPEQLQELLGVVPALDVPGIRAALVLPADPANELNNSWKWGWILVHLEDRGWRLTRSKTLELAELVDCRDQRKVMIVSAAVARTDAVQGQQLIDMQDAIARKHVALASNLAPARIHECEGTR